MIYELNDSDFFGRKWIVYTGPRDEKPKPVSFVISAESCGFDKKYIEAKVNWSYPENKKTQSIFKIGKPWEIMMKPYEIRVLELSLS